MMSAEPLIMSATLAEAFSLIRPTTVKVRAFR